jgi:tyrosyl-tRNA synthetase
VSPEEWLQTVLNGSEEVVTREELRTLLDRTGTPRAYVGLEPSGLMHIGTAFIIGSKVEDLVRAGFHTIIFLADWHAYINDKLGRDLENLRICADYFKDGFRAVDVPDSVEYLYANEFVRHPEYWQTVIQASKASTVARIRRALTIMGRKEEDADLDASKLIYPAMQVADIHWMDQRHAHMLYRDVAPKLGWKQVVALHTPLLPALDGGGRMDLVAGKMSKSRPDASVLLSDSPRDIERKIGKAFCPAKEPVGNPVLEIARLILFPRRGKLMIPRDSKFGGDVTYASFTEVAKAYADGELHPKDLKSGVAAGLNEQLVPVRKFFEAHRQGSDARRRSNSFRKTRFRLRVTAGDSRESQGWNRRRTCFPGVRDAGTRRKKGDEPG